MKLCCFALGKAQQKYQLSGSPGIRVNGSEKEEKEGKKGRKPGSNETKIQLKVKEFYICFPEIEYLTKRVIKK